jgi:hypothetical protein
MVNGFFRQAGSLRPGQGGEVPGRSRLCGWQRFFPHIDEPVQTIVRSPGVPVVKEASTRAANHWEAGKGG